jgi:hypothetical protein
MSDWAITEPETSLILGNVRRMLNQTHTDLLATLKERVEEISKDISDPYPFDNGYTYAPFVPLSDLFTLIDSLLVTDEQV